MTKRPLWAAMAAGLGVLLTILAFQARTWLNSEQTRLTDQRATEILNRDLPVGTDNSCVKQLLDRKAGAHSEEKLDYPGHPGHPGHGPVMHRATA
jgi:hypothetical protein